MAAPQRNYPYNPHLARAALFNRNDPHFSSIISNFDSDGGEEDQVLPSALPPAGHGNQEAQGINTANNSELDAATGGQNTLPTPPVESASVPGAGAAHEAANQTLTDDVAETTAQLPTATAHSAPASGEADTDMDVPQEAVRRTFAYSFFFRVTMLTLTPTLDFSSISSLQISTRSWHFGWDLAHRTQLADFPHQ
ncbi:hypothetical protein M407DRAFT_23396 [Tulasnella calospora MUT 4182]|uniref:Uncharacterized protein n=1 Tax=Tulasnella calospora MUT 4182 TaxID=1051891 RepID=A0A0C3QLA2_9AGAM|nr:hypothetical protein M407DRAFT_23396 [Tulasnella calospora MUT 4182]